MFSVCVKPEPADVQEARQKSRVISKQLKKDYVEFFQKIKLLLLGTGESGKTTIIKQTKILHINGFSNAEKMEKIPFIKQNIHESIYSIVFNMTRLNPPVTITHEIVRKSEEYVLNLGPKEPVQYPDEYFDHVKILWADQAVQEAFKRSNEYQLIDSAQHFLDKIDEIRLPTYIPDIQDILFCRIETTTISKIEFSIPVPKHFGGGKANFWMFDVGGQRGHRRKWIQVFDGIQAILFLIASSDFDQTLREDESKNRLEEALEIFDQLCTSRYVRGADFIVFLNKQDILKKKIEAGKKIEHYFPEYANYKPSATSEYDRANNFIRDKVLSIASKPIPEGSTKYILPGVSGPVESSNREIYIHSTIATNTENVKLILKDVQSSIIEKNIERIYN